MDAANAATRKPREKVNSKADLVNAFQPVIKQIFGERVSKTDVWKVYKAAVAVSAALAASGKPLSLMGVGRWHVILSQRSVKKNKPAKRLRFVSSQRLTDLLNGESNFVETMVAEAEAEGGEETPGATVKDPANVLADKGAKKAKKAEKKAGAPKDIPQDVTL